MSADEEKFPPLVTLTELMEMEVPGPGRARIVEGEIVCDTTGCSEPADTIHFLPWVTKPERIEAACPAHDPDGYWMDLESIQKKWTDILLHLAGKVGHAEHALLCWLGYEGAQALRLPGTPGLVPLPGEQGP